MVDHDTLIDALSADAAPVRRVAPVWRRLVLWSVLALALGFAGSRLAYRPGTDWSGPLAWLGMANVALSLTLGLAAFAAALSMSIAGRDMRPGGGVLAGLGAAWLALCAFAMSLPLALPVQAQAGLAQAGSTHAGEGHAASCFLFVLSSGVPMIVVAVLALRRTRALRPMRPLMLAGVAVAFLSFGLLGFCHPVELAPMDFATHLAAGLLLGLVTVVAGRRLIAA